MKKVLLIMSWMVAAAAFSETAYGQQPKQDSPELRVQDMLMNFLNPYINVLYVTITSKLLLSVRWFIRILLM